MANVKPSAVREILKVTADPSFISFAAGNPSGDLFPVEALREYSLDVLANPASLQYSVTEGYQELRDLVSERYGRGYNLKKPGDDTIIVSGGQQGIDLAARCLLEEGDAVICENPSFIGALNCFRMYNAELVGIPCDEYGMLLDELEVALEANPRVKLIYTIPTFQNPGGTTLPLERRRKMLELALKYDIMILEDSPYFELSFDGTFPPAIKSLDDSGHVIFVGSFSKIIAPGIRVGFVIAPDWLTSKMTVAKQGADVHTNGVYMRVAAEFLKNYDVDAHILRCRTLYKEKCGLMLAEMEKKIDKRVRWTKPGGGLFIWCELPADKPSAGLCETLKQQKVAIVPGVAFDTDPDNLANCGFRLNFSVPSNEQIISGIGLLAEGISEYLDK
jgi:2-aminoadipate transaminase